VLTNLPCSGPPLHDALCVLHLAQPELLPGRWAHLSVDVSDTERNGETRATFFSPEGTVDELEDRAKFFVDDEQGDVFPNCLVMETLDREAFMRVLLECVDRAEEVIAKDTL
jgi:inosine-uridine nucleoside N-ribohydrolase